MCVGLAGKGDQGMQNPGGLGDRPVSYQFLERSVQLSCDTASFFLIRDKNGNIVEITVCLRHCLDKFRWQLKKIAAPSALH